MYPLRVTCTDNRRTHSRFDGIQFLENVFFRFLLVFICLEALGISPSGLNTVKLWSKQQKSMKYGPGICGLTRRRSSSFWMLVGRKCKRSAGVLMCILYVVRLWLIVHMSRWSSAFTGPYWEYGCASEKLYRTVEWANLLDAQKFRVSELFYSLVNFFEWSKMV